MGFSNLLPHGGYTLEDLRDPSTMLDVLGQLGWQSVQEDHTYDCPALQSSGVRCICVPNLPTWVAPKTVYEFLGETWPERLARARTRKGRE